MSTKTTNSTESMNAYQKATFHNFIAKALCNGRHEVKEFEVTDFKDDGDDDVMVFIEVGMPNDEGTMAELICRDRYRFFIGKRGGLYRYGNKGGMTPLRFNVVGYFKARVKY